MNVGVQVYLEEKQQVNITALYPRQGLRLASPLSQPMFIHQLSNKKPLSLISVVSIYSQ